MPDQRTATGRTEQELDAEADEPLAVARAMPSGPEKNEALKRAGLLRRAADAPEFHSPDAAARPKAAAYK